MTAGACFGGGVCLGCVAKTSLGFEGGGIIRSPGAIFGGGVRMGGGAGVSFLAGVNPIGSRTERREPIVGEFIAFAAGFFAAGILLTLLPHILHHSHVFLHVFLHASLARGFLLVTLHDL